MLVCLLLAGSAAALTDEMAGSLFREGSAAFRDANEKARSEPEQARALYKKAFLRFEQIEREGGIRNGKLYYNIGNCYFRMEDIGRAILNYRRAEQYMPNDPNLHQNLEYARSKRLDRIDVKQTTRVLNTLFFWHYDVSTKTRSVVFVGFFVLLWACALARIFVPRPWLAWLAGISALLAVLFLGSLLVETAALERNKAGVIVAPQIVARQGDGESFDPSFKEPLHAGTEFELVEKRPDWYRVELADGRKCWVPAQSTGLVR